MRSSYIHGFVGWSCVQIMYMAWLCRGLKPADGRRSADDASPTHTHTQSKYAALGPDPLREDADKERLWAKMQATAKPIGQVRAPRVDGVAVGRERGRGGSCVMGPTTASCGLSGVTQSHPHPPRQVLMDQSCVAGIGNIYRAEILFKSGVHPEQPARTLPRAVFELIWTHSVLLLQRGFLTGSILTVDPEEARVLGPKWCVRCWWCGWCECGGSWGALDMMFKRHLYLQNPQQVPALHLQPEHLRPLQGPRPLL